MDELLGRSNGVGFQIHLYFQLFDVRAILGYPLAFVVAMLAIEFPLVQPVERRAYRWRAWSTFACPARTVTAGRWTAWRGTCRAASQG